MLNFIPRAEAVLQHLDQFLAQFAAMISQQRTANGQQTDGSPGAALLKQMLHAWTVVEERRRDLRASLRDGSADRFVHELWSLAGDMAHFDFDLSHLAGADTFTPLREALSLEALILTKELTDATNKAAFVAELGARH